MGYSRFARKETTHANTKKAKPAQSGRERKASYLLTLGNLEDHFSSHPLSGQVAFGREILKRMTG
jgi:hypothetical protein